MAKKSKQKADEQYLSGHPTRLEVANYVNALLEERYLPHVQGLIQMSSMVLQAILIKKGICTGEELRSITEEFVKEQERRTKAMEGIKSGELLKEVLTDKYVENLKAHADKISKGEFSFQDADIQGTIASQLKKSAEMLKTVVQDKIEFDEVKREVLLKELMESKRQMEDGSIRLSNPEHKPILMGMLWDAIIPFAHKHLGKPIEEKADE